MSLGGSVDSLSTVTRTVWCTRGHGVAVAPSGKFVACAVGQEHRLGRWYRARQAKNALVLVQLPEGPLFDAAEKEPSNSRTNRISLRARVSYPQASATRISPGASSSQPSTPSSAASPRATHSPSIWTTPSQTRPSLVSMACSWETRSSLSRERVSGPRMLSA